MVVDHGFLSRMNRICVVMVMFGFHHLYTSAQDCPSGQDLQSSLRQVDKLLAAHEASYQQSLRSLRKKLSALKNSTVRSLSSAGTGAGTIPSTPSRAPGNATCPKPDSLANGRRLGRVFAVGHEVHFVCKSGYELLGPQTRVCLESLRWSGQQPACRLLNSSSPAVRLLQPAPPASTPSPSTAPSSPSPSRSTSPSPASPASPSSSKAPPLSAFVRPSRCTQFRGSTHCTCDVGFTISGRDNSVCTDIEECALFPLAQPGRLCMYTCVNTPGSFQCVCPAGYDLTRDNRSCTDIDECEGGQHNCTRDQVCVNTYGGFQCTAVECPRFKNATYIKTSPMRCERNPCLVGDHACSQAPNSISFHFLSLVSNMSAPRVLFRVSAARALGDTLRFGLAGGRGHGYFSVQRSGRQTGTLLLVSPVEGPATLEAEVEMSELDRRALLGRYLTKVTMFVSPYSF